jgi:hypothetical protein
MLGSTECKNVATDGQGKWLLNCGNGSPSTGYVFSEDNAQNFSARSAPGGSAFYYGVGYSHEWWFLGVYASQTMYRSRDLITWESKSLSSASDNRKVVGDDRGNVLTHGGSATAPQVSFDDGHTWQAGGIAFATAYPVQYAQDKYVMLGGTQGYGMHSYDKGRSWYRFDMPFSGVTWSNACYNPWLNLWIACVVSDTRYALSNDGVNWWIPNNRRPSGASSPAITATPGGFLVVSQTLANVEFGIATP